MLWGGSGFVGGLALALIAALTLWLILAGSESVVWMLESMSRRYAVVRPASARRWHSLLGLFAFANLVVPFTAWACVYLPFSPFKAAIVRCYAEVPAVESAREYRWAGPMPVGPGRWQYGVFEVHLGSGFEARITEDAAGIHVSLNRLDHF